MARRARKVIARMDCRDRAGRDGWRRRDVFRRRHGAFLQLGLLTVHPLPLRQTVNTTMLVLVFVSGSGGAAQAGHGDVSVPHLVGLTIGLASGAYIGALHPAKLGWKDNVPDSGGF